MMRPMSGITLAVVKAVGRVHDDLRDAMRALRAGRGTTVLAFILLTLTMAAVTVTFSVVDAIAVRPLPYGSPDRLVSLSLPTDRPGRGLPASPEKYFAWREETRAFQGIAAARPGSALDLRTRSGVESLRTWRVSTDLFEVLDVRPLAGRFFSPEHERPGAPAVVLVSHAVWVRQFNSDPEVVGRLVPFADGPREVLGVLPEGVAYPLTLTTPPDLYVPYVVTPEERSNHRGFSMWVVGRIRDGLSFEQARADVERMSSALVVALHDQVVGPAKAWLLLALAAVGVVLLVACGNVGSLLLARAVSRAHEFATREALGASRRRLSAGVLLEGLILALASGAAAVVLASWGLEIAKASLPAGLTRVQDIALDGRVLFASVVGAVCCGLIVAGAPAWLTGRSELFSLMKAGGGPLIGGGRRDRSLSVFLVANIALVTVLLVASTLVVTSFRLITTADLGFDRRDVMSIWFQRPVDGVAERDLPAVVAAVRAELLTRATSVPGVISAAISNSGSPLSGSRSGQGVIIPGFGPVSGSELASRAVTPDYFRVMGMELLGGRLFEASDGAGAPPVMLINDVAARRFFGGRDPIGQVVTYPFPPPGPATIVGVLKGTRNSGPEADVEPEIYTPLDQQPARALVTPSRGLTVGGLLVRTDGDPRRLAPAVREAIRPALGGLDPQEAQFVDDYFRRLTAQRRFNAELMAVFGLLALAIGALGVYGTMAFFVARQVRAIGLRMALGASPPRVLRSVLKGALARVALGAAIGLAAAWGLSNVFTAYVYGVQPTDLRVYAGVAVFLVLVGLVTALEPARRAAQLDPLTALRQD
jgi:putative ABC transport system permease protein